MTLHSARILSSETDNTIKQEQNTNVNIKITPPNKPIQRPATVPLYPSGSSASRYPQVPSVDPNINFTQANQHQDTVQDGPITDSPQTTSAGTYQYQPPINNHSPLVMDRGIADLGSEINELDKKNKFLEMLVAMYESNPLKINSYVVCDSKLLMNMIKILTDCDKVDLVIDDSHVGCECGCGCGLGSGVRNDKLIYVSKILITKDNKTEEFKHKYNDIYTQFIRYGISMKMTY